VQNRQDEARRVLAQVYDRFKEGLQSPDLTEAKTLLEDLAATGSSAS
jgi:hypothetical protein